MKKVFSVTGKSGGIRTIRADYVKLERNGHLAFYRRHPHPFPDELVYAYRRGTWDYVKEEGQS